MVLRSGERLGAYEIVESIGRGGMGEVFRARDPRMARDVAVKVSTESFPERFEREVHAIAALNHPNICAIYDVGPDYLVLELVEGPTLAERIAEAPLQLDELLRIARQIADALEAAHERGIVHRDLKPGNIKLTSSGTVKVLDFGLAKLGGTPTASTDHSPTLSMQATQAGVILGTAAYMAPEQARGKAVDSRADIWAFGVVVYEMATGRRLFQGEDLTDTLASVVKVDPDLRPAPPQLRRLLRKCLEKDPSKRLRHIGDAWELIDEPPAATSTARGTLRTFGPWAVAGLVTAALGALAVLHFREVPPELQAVQFSMDAPGDAAFSNLYGGHAASPDGKYIVFSATSTAAGGSVLWLRSLDSASSRRLMGTERANFPAWSPDSQSIVFAADGKLKRLDLTGGVPLTLGDATTDPVTPTAAWNREGVILFGSASGLQRVAASGGGVTQFTQVGAGETGHGYPQFLPDGRRFLYFVASPDANVQGVYASSLDNPAQREQILRTASKAVFVPPKAAHPGYLVWLQNEILVAQQFDPASFRRTGDPIALAEDIGVNPGNTMRAAFWASDSGLLIYFADPSALTRRVVWMTRDGHEIGDALPQDSLVTPALSRDATRLAVARRAAQGSKRLAADIYVWEFARKTSTRLTFTADADGFPVWSPEGTQVAYISRREGGESGIYRKHASGGGQEEQLVKNADAMPLDWSQDGAYLLYRQRHRDTSWDLMALPLEGERQPIPVVQTPYAEILARFSPNRRWVAYVSNESERDELYVRAFSPAGAQADGGRWQISNTGASDVQWRHDGRELYFETPDGTVMAVDIEEVPDGIRAGTPRSLFSAPIDTATAHSMVATADGQRFLLALTPRAGPDPAPLTVVVNWQAMRRR